MACADTATHAMKSSTRRSEPPAFCVIESNTAHSMARVSSSASDSKLGGFSHEEHWKASEK